MHREEGEQWSFHSRLSSKTCEQDVEVVQRQMEEVESVNMERVTSSELDL